MEFTLRLPAVRRPGYQRLQPEAKDLVSPSLGSPKARLWSIFTLWPSVTAESLSWLLRAGHLFLQVFCSNPTLLLFFLLFLLF